MMDLIKAGIKVIFKRESTPIPVNVRFIRNPIQEWYVTSKEEINKQLVTITAQTRSGEHIEPYLINSYQMSNGRWWLQVSFAEPASGSVSW